MPWVYLTAKTHKKLILKGGMGGGVDPETHELFWPALACGNPDCPERKGDEPVLFIDPDMGII